MNCRDFDSWLDEGRPSGARAEARVHANACARCAGSLAAAGALRQVLSQRFATADDRFTDRVMSRIGARAPGPLLSPALDEPTFPWWIRALQEPGTVLAFVLGAILLAWGRDLADIAAQMATPVARHLAVELPWAGHLAGGHAPLLLPWGLVVLPALAVAAWGLFRASRMLAGRAGR